jgi:hypothetical protein
MVHKVKLVHSDLKVNKAHKDHEEEKVLLAIKAQRVFQELLVRLVH